MVLVRERNLKILTTSIKISYNTEAEMKPTDVSSRDVGFRRGQGSESCQEKRQERSIFAGDAQTFLASV